MTTLANHCYPIVRVCPKCNSHNVSTHRHMNAKIWCSDCGHVLREEGKQSNIKGIRQMTETYYYNSIRRWAHDRNIIEGLTPHSQFVKLVEEFSEIPDDPLDGIGDSLVVMTIICEMRGIKLENLMGTPSENSRDSFPLHALGLLAGDIARGRCIIDSMQNLLSVIHNYCWLYHVKIVDCLAQAWNEIKDRKGIVKGGVFIKEADLCNTQVQSL